MFASSLLFEPYTTLETEGGQSQPQCVASKQSWSATQTKRDRLQTSSTPTPARCWYNISWNWATNHRRVFNWVEMAVLYHPFSTRALKNPQKMCTAQNHRYKRTACVSSKNPAFWLKFTFWNYKSLGWLNSDLDSRSPSFSLSPPLHFFTKGQSALWAPSESNHFCTWSVLTSYKTVASVFSTATSAAVAASKQGDRYGFCLPSFGRFVWFCSISRSLNQGQ